MDNYGEYAARKFMSKPVDCEVFVASAIAHRDVLIKCEIDKWGEKSRGSITLFYSGGEVEIVLAARDLGSDSKMAINISAEMLPRLVVALVKAQTAIQRIQDEIARSELKQKKQEHGA